MSNLFRIRTEFRSYAVHSHKKDTKALIVVPTHIKEPLAWFALFKIQVFKKKKNNWVLYSTLPFPHNEYEKYYLRYYEKSNYRPSSS